MPKKKNKDSEGYVGLPMGGRLVKKSTYRWMEKKQSEDAKTILIIMAIIAVITLLLKK